MSDAIIATGLTCIVTLIGIFVSAKATRDSVTNELDKKTALQQQEIDHIKESIVDMKEDLKEHNHYAKLFAESMPVVQERIKVANNRIADLEEQLKAERRLP